MKKSFFDNIDKIYIIIVLIIIILFIIKGIIAYTTRFTKTITVKNLSYYKGSKIGYNLVEDETGKIYNVQNTIFYLFFEGAELYASLEENKKYNITGYGLRVPFLNWYKHIIKAVPV